MWVSITSIIISCPSIHFSFSDIISSTYPHSKHFFLAMAVNKFCSMNNLICALIVYSSYSTNLKSLWTEKQNCHKPHYFIVGLCHSSPRFLISDEIRASAGNLSLSYTGNSQWCNQNMLTPNNYTLNTLYSAVDEKHKEWCIFIAFPFTYIPDMPGLKLGWIQYILTVEVCRFPQNLQTNARIVPSNKS
jgi:hypothetical protein